MSHGLLLRLFLSPSFFSVHVALQYLMLYADNVGITYYLTGRLKELDAQELRDVWGFICHLLVTRPSKSRALECFVVKAAEKSTHTAMLTLWFMQAFLRDLATRHNSPSFAICQRLVHKCHEIIFGRVTSPSSSPYTTLKLPIYSRYRRQKVRPNVEPALVGIGTLIAGAPGMPLLTDIVGHVAIEQGRMHEESTGTYRSTDEVNVMRDSPAETLTNDFDEDQTDDAHSGEGDKSEAIDDLIGSVGVGLGSPVTPQTDKISAQQDAAPSRSRRRTIGASRTSPSLPFRLSSSRIPRLSYDPFDQSDPPPLAGQPSSNQSVPSISTFVSRFSKSNSAELILQGYERSSQVLLLRSHYCRSEVQFLLTLENISNRLLVIPRPARVSALRAELTALNHKLPAEVCMPMWCPSSDVLRPSQDIPQPHHRIVRIPPGESVILNSAEHAPFLLLIEILTEDLDFDPAKRGNKEVLKKIVLDETEQKKDPVGLKGILPLGRRSTPDGPIALDIVSTAEALQSSDWPTATDAISVTPVPRSFAISDEEVDLVEQLYGPDSSIRSRTAALDESISLPPAPKNKALEAAAWSRSSSVPPSPSMDKHISSDVSTTPSVPPVIASISELNYNGKVLSLDDYSDRMRTAAVMLAQLNANMVRDPVTSLNLVSALEAVPMSGALSWLSGGSRTSTSETQKNAGPVHPSLTGGPQHHAGISSTSGSIRVMLQPSEAAAIRGRIMQEMLALEDERMQRMRESSDDGTVDIALTRQNMKTVEDESIIRRELSRADPSAIVFSESWMAKKSRIRHSSPYGHLANWDCVSVIVKTGGDLRQEQLAVQLIREFERIWTEENCQCWVRFFRILVTGGSSGMVETITDAMSIHSIKKAEYARRLTEGRLGHVTLFDHFTNTYGDPSSAKFVRARRNFVKSLAGYSIVTYLLQIKDRHNGNILLDRDGHLIHIDFGFMLSNSPGNIGFEAAPFKLPLEYIDVLGGVDSESFIEFKRLFREGFEAARKHCDKIITLVELMQKDSALPCFASFGEQTANQLRDRFQPALTHPLVEEYVERLIVTSLGSNWTRLYDSYQYYSQSIL